MYQEQIISFNPATKEEIGRIPIAKKLDIHNAVESSKKAFNEWKSLTFETRGNFLKNLATELEHNIENIAKLITSEMGKPIKESAGEVTKTSNFLKFFAEKAEGYMLDSSIQDTGEKEAKIIYEPIGSVAAIKPWNLPLQTPIWAIGPALMSGCTVVLKPSENTLLVAKELEKLVMKCNFPKGVLSVIYGGKETGMSLLHENIDMVSFTGSVAAGKQVSKSVADRFIKTSLELGGKDAIIVLPDCDLDFAAMAIVWGSTTNCGQFCSSIERVYIHREIYKPLLDRVVELTRQIRVGNGINSNIDMGPVVNEQQYNLILNHINDALSKGAKALIGGSSYDKGELSKGYFIKPTVLVDINHNMDIMKVETFGPIICAMPFDDLEKGISLVNDSYYGLGASIITQDKDLAEKIASDIDVGMVWINEPLLSMAACPWIARKGSGLGYELGQIGLHEFVKPKLINSQYEDNKKNRIWWYPY